MPAKTQKGNAAAYAHLPAEGVFLGLNTNVDAQRPIIRQKPQPIGATALQRKAFKRANEQKMLWDMYRQALKSVEKAIENKNKHSLSPSKFVLAREKHKVPMEGGSPFGKLAEEELNLSVADGPALLVDLDDVIVFWYFPEFIGQGLQAVLVDRVAKLAKVFPPQLDGKKGECRSKASFKTIPKVFSKQEPSGLMTRSRTRGLDQQEDPVGTAQLSEATPMVAAEASSRLEDEHHSDSNHDWEDRREVDKEDAETLEPYVDSEGEVAWLGKTETPHMSIAEAVPKDIRAGILKVLDKSDLGPSRYYLSPGWFQTAREKSTPIVVSSQFRDALKDASQSQMINLLEAKRLYDWQLAYLTDIIHDQLGSSMRKLREHMLQVRGPTKVVLQNGWTSSFPCFGLGINRNTSAHRDSNGHRGGIDIIGVLGDVRASKFRLQDLNVSMEWVAGCVGAFDGYDLTHEVLSWEGSHRITLLSFCRKSTWAGLGLELELESPTLPRVQANLEQAKRLRMEKVEAGKRKRQNGGE
ncbi:hypothetical protein BDV93DRAFT_564252 [Ceratobasidium sp. AG-I]|nr:hypothetical protein BDV93DRAFT_564252 [Ceratobasidium sp. AG-I]